MIAEIISIGDEILVGQIVNTNATWIASHLNEIGIVVKQVSAIADDAEDIKKALDIAFSRADVILVTGGLGPTKDDITKHTICEYFNTHLVFHQPTYDHLVKLFAIRGWSRINEVNRKQAEIPANCIPLTNHVGTAPGMLFEKDKKILVSMPGVPFEMEDIMINEVLPRLAGKENDRIIVHKTIQTQGVGESFLAEKIKDWEDNLPATMKLAYLPQPGLVRLRLTAYGQNKKKLLQEIDRQINSIKGLIPDYIFGYNDDTLEEVVGRLLKEKHCTLSTAESCTGGYLAHLVTSVPGSSDYYTGSVIAYSNSIKQELLGVSEQSLIDYGAVSEQVVREMCEGARKRFSTDFAVSTSGVAGPDGGTAEKPVGTVWIAVASKTGTVAKKFMFGEHRGRNIRRAALAALNMVRVEVGR
jgi:nicotinamide-nucleotide amidase